MSTQGPYFIIFQDNMYRIDPKIFEKMSSKFAEEYPNNPRQLDFTENIAKETFEVFINSCQLKNFEIRPNIALEVLDISREWGIPSLEAHTIQFCRDHGIKFRPREDYIGILLEKIDNNEESVKDLQNVADILNDSFDDDRLPDVDPECLYRIVVLAEKNNLDMQKLIDFTMKLYDTNPESACLLTLRIDFDLLTEDQVQQIYQCVEMHEISMGFFVAFSLSAVRNRTKANLVESERKHIEAMNQFQREQDYERRHMIMRLDAEHNAEMHKLMETLMAQHRKIEELTDILTAQAEALDSGPLSPRGIGDENLRRIKEETDAKLVKIRDHIDEEVQEKLRETADVFEQAVAKVEDEWERENADPTRVAAETNRVCSLAEERGAKYEAALAEIAASIKGSKCGVAAKVVRDKMRTTKGLREDQGKGSKFGLFDANKDLWNLEKEDVQAQYKLIKELERLVDEVCPIRGGAVSRSQKQ